MFLSDKLIEIGKKSNPKNNRSMGEAVKEMNAECKRAIKAGETPERTKITFRFAAMWLNQNFHPFFNPDQYEIL